MIDAHHHFWQYNEHEYSWITPDMAPLRTDFGPAQLIEECVAANVTGVISVQARSSLRETDALLARAARHPLIRGVVGWFDLTAADVGATLDRYAEDARLVGVREVCQGAPDDAFFENPAFQRGVAELKLKQLTYDVLIFSHQLSSAARFVDRLPEQRFVVDHCAKPEIRRNAFPKSWAADLRELARRPHVFCKFSGLTTEIHDADRQWDAALLRPYFDTAIEAFGPQRVMFGSDWPVSLLGSRYNQWITLCREFAASLSGDEAASLLQGSAVRFYGLDD